MSKWIAEFELEDGDTMPEHMDLEYKGAKIDFHCRPMWIPVSERLPDKRGDYLVTLCGNGEPWVEIALWNETFGGRWQMVLYNDVDYSDISNVIAWMPLPKPYQEGEQE